MENATKALLIAAAVLIAIILVALGVKLLGSTGDTTEDAEEVAGQIGTATNSAISSLDTALGNLDGNNSQNTETTYDLKINGVQIPVSINIEYWSQVVENNNLFTIDSNNYLLWKGDKVWSYYNGGIAYAKAGDKIRTGISYYTDKTETM